MYWPNVPAKNHVENAKQQCQKLLLTVAQTAADETNATFMARYSTEWTWFI